MEKMFDFGRCVGRVGVAVSVAIFVVAEAGVIGAVRRVRRICSG